MPPLDPLSAAAVRASVPHDLARPTRALPLARQAPAFALPLEAPAMDVHSRLATLADGSLERDRAREAGQGVERIFATLLAKELRKALPNEGFFGESAGADVFNGWLDEFLGERLAQDGVLGLGARVQSELEAEEGART